MVSKDITHNFRIKIQIYKIPKIWNDKSLHNSLVKEKEKKEKEKQKPLLNILKYTLI